MTTVHRARKLARTVFPFVGIGLTLGFLALRLLDLHAFSRGRVGVTYQFDGTRVGSVTPGSTADRTGIQPGDRLLQIDHHQIATPDDLETALAGLASGSVIVVRRGKDVESLTVPEGTAGEPGLSCRFDGSILISAVAEDLPADRAGIQPGDHLLALAGQPMRTNDELQAAHGELQPHTPVTFQLRRGDEVVEATLRPGVATPWQDEILPSLVVLVTLGIGLLALRRSSGYLNGHLLFYLSTAIAVEFALPEGLEFDFFDRYSVLFYCFVSGLQLGLDLHLASLIPERLGLARRFPWLIPSYYVFGLCASGTVALTWVTEGLLESDALPWSYATVAGLFQNWVITGWAIGLMALLAARVVTYPEAEGRYQVAVVFLGDLPWALYVMITLLVKELPAWFESLVPIFVIGFPLALLVVIVREAQEQRRVLLHLSENIQKHRSLSEIAALIGADLEMVFHPKWSCVFYAAFPQRELALGHSSGDRAQIGNMPALDHFREIVKQRAEPFELSSIDLAALPADESSFLTGLGPKLVVPMLGGDHRLVGLILLGEKKAEEPYTRHDLKLLHTLAGQVAMVLDNLRLRDDVSEGKRIQRKVLARLQDQNINAVKECPRCHGCFDSTEETCPHDGTELVLSLPIERVIDGRYRLDRLVGRGGMGAVYEATDERLGRKAALKILIDFDRSEALRRFEREAKVCARLAHPNIVAIYDFGRLVGEGAYLVMERLEGKTLRTLLDESAPIAPPTAADWFDQVLDGLAAAHESHIVHRDLKPSNLFLVTGSDGATQVKILDFGLAKVRSATQSMLASITAPGTLLGTLHYMAPEQLMDGDVDERTDIFAVGVLVVEAITGSRPFRGNTQATLTTSILHESYQLPGTAPGVAKLDRVLRKCLAKKPEQRFSSVGDLREALIPALRACPPFEISEARRTRGVQHTLPV